MVPTTSLPTSQNAATKVNFLKDIEKKSINYISCLILEKFGLFLIATQEPVTD